MRDVFIRVIDDPNAPERLRGLEVQAVVTERAIDFEVDLPADVTPNELGYMRIFTSDLVDKIQERTGVQISFRAFEKKS